MRTSNHSTRSTRSALAITASALLTIGIAIGGATAANAAESAPSVRAGDTTAKVGGGLWQYGVTSWFVGTVYSNYHHATKYHTATACDGALLKTCTQVAAAANKWAKASKPASPSGNTASWNTY